MAYQITDQFVLQLFAHPAFQQQLSKFNRNAYSVGQKRSSPSQVSNIVEQICGMLSEQFKNKIDSECLSIYHSHLHMMKEIQRIKSSMSLASPTKSSICVKNISNSILSQLMDPQASNSRVRRQPEQVLVDRVGNNSFMSSFIFESEAKQMKQQLQERINATIINLSGDVAKFQSSVEQRLKNVQQSLTHKMESIYKTMTSIFQTINDLQTKLQTKPLMDHYQNDQHPNPYPNKLQTRISNKESKEREVVGREQIPKRRSFLGFIKY